MRAGLLLSWLAVCLPEALADEPSLNLVGLRGAAAPSFTEREGGEPPDGAQTRPVRVIILKLDRTGSSLLGYSLNDLPEDVLCAMVNDTPLKAPEKWDTHKWVEAELFAHHYGHEYTSDDLVLRIKKNLGFQDVCGEVPGDKDCKARRQCAGGAAFWGFTLAAVKDHNQERTKEVFQKLAEYILTLPPEERPFVWVHKRRNVVLQALSAMKPDYMDRVGMCPGVSRYHLDPARCPEAMEPMPVEPEELAKYVDKRVRQGDKTIFYASQVAAAAAGVVVTDEEGWLWHSEQEGGGVGSGGGKGWPRPLLDCTDPRVGCRRVEGVLSGEGPVNAVSTSYEFLTGNKDNGARALGEMLGGQGATSQRWRQLMADLSPVDSPKSSPSNTRDKVENFDELLEHAAKEPEDSPWRGPWGYVAQLCEQADPPCADWVMEMTL